AIFDAYRKVLDSFSKRQADRKHPAAASLHAALFERAIWHYTTVLQTGGAGIGPVGRGGLVPRRARRQFFECMHADFTRYVPPGYRYPPGARGAKFRLIRHDAYWTYELLEPLNRARVALRRRADRGPGGSGGGGPARRSATAAVRCSSWSSRAMTGCRCLSIAADNASAVPAGACGLRGEYPAIAAA